MRLLSRFRLPIYSILFVALSILSQNSALAESVHLVLGNPTKAKSDATMKDNFLIEREQYALSYNNDKGTPNWVAWQVSKDWLGDVDRHSFKQDKSLPAAFYQVKITDYKKSDYDRGHLCPSADRNKSTTDNKATFLMSNMIPQRAALNRGPWKKLESYCRDLVRRGNTICIYAGGYGQQKKLKGKIVAPKRCWKVIVILPKKDANADDITEDTRVIAVDMPNHKTIWSQDWTMYLTTVDSIEDKAEIDLLANVPDDVEEKIESSVDDESDVDY